VDLGGCTSVAMVWRAAMAIEMGLCQAVLCVLPARMAPFGPDEDPAWMARAMRYGGHSTAFGAPEAEFDLPYGHMGQNTGYAMIAQRYAAQYGYDPLAMAKIAVDQRTNALANPDAMFFGKPLGAEEVLASKMVADPLHVLEIVMPVAGGAAVIVASKELAAKARHRGAAIKGFGEHLSFKSPTYAADMTRTPSAPPPPAPLRWPASSPPMWTRPRSTTATPSPCCSPSKTPALPQGRRHALGARARPDLAGQLPDEHPRRPAELRPGGHCRRHVAGDRGLHPDFRPRRRASAQGLRHRFCIRHRRRDERAGRTDSPGSLTSMSTNKPMPAQTEISAPFWEGLKSGRLTLPRCNSCGHWIFYPAGTATNAGPTTWPGTM
jgi:hypothetical protein